MTAETISVQLID